jgi:3-hydroxyisobutyrate dehydrogenase-like beta-hydroxyacid dehydrogenase
MNIGFIGLGRMGSGMAASLLRAGHAVTVFNRTAAKAEPLIAQGAKRAASVADACRNDVVFTMLANDAAVEDIVYRDRGVLASLGKGKVHVSSSTISVALVAELAADHAAKRQKFVAAPVFGRPEAAADGKVFVLAAGESDATKCVMPLLQAIGQKTFLISETPEKALLVKLSGNFLVASVIEALGEAIALVGKGGVEKTQYLEILTSSLFDAPIYKTYGGLIVREAFESVGFAAPLGEKDIGLALAAAEELRVPMPFASTLRNRFLTLLANGGDRLDWSAIGGLAAKDAGLAAR